MFLGLYDPSLKSFVISKEHWRHWTDNVFLPAVRETLPAKSAKEFPGSAEHAQAEATAKSVEGGVQDNGQARLQYKHHRVQPQYLEALWQRVRLLSQQHDEDSRGPGYS